MECPGCKGLKIIHVRAVPGVHQQYDVECPVCNDSQSLALYRAVGDRRGEAFTFLGIGFVYSYWEKNRKR